MEYCSVLVPYEKFKAMGKPKEKECPKCLEAEKILSSSGISPKDFPHFSLLLHGLHNPESLQKVPRSEYAKFLGRLYRKKLHSSLLV